MVDSAGAILEAIAGLGNQLEQRLIGLQTLFDREIRAEATRERIVDRLHAELQDYKQDLLLKVQRPIFVDLIQLHDDIGKMIDAQPTDDADRSAAVRGTARARFARPSKTSSIARASSHSGRGRRVRPPPPARRDHRADRGARAEQDDRRPPAPGLSGRRQAHPAGDRVGLHPEEMRTGREERGHDCTAGSPRR